MLSFNEKQELIRRTIEEHDLSAIDLFEYLQSRKANGGDSNNWTLSELESEMRNFVQLRPTTQRTMLDEDEAVNGPNGKKIDPKSGFCLIEEDECLQQDEFKVGIKNKLSLNEFFCTDSISIRITKESIEKSFLFLSSSRFTIYTGPFGWSVDRYLEDFFRLRRSLARSFPLILVA